MNPKVLVLRHDEVVYKGKLLGLPFKHDAIIAKSIELFDDDEPCVIHQSYVIKTYADQLMSWMEDGVLAFKDRPETYDWLAFDDVDALVLKVR